MLIELKAKKFNHADASQLGIYMAYYRKHMMQPDDNPPVGILLCTAVGDETMEYVNTFIDPKLFVSKYQLQLPEKSQVSDRRSLHAQKGHLHRARGVPSAEA